MQKNIAYFTMDLYGKKVENKSIPIKFTDQKYWEMTSSKGWPPVRDDLLLGMTSKKRTYIPTSFCQHILIKVSSSQYQKG